MKGLLYLCGALAALGGGVAASAQFSGREDPMPVTQPKMPGEYWAPKPTQPTAYSAPNKVHWKLADIRAAHRGQSDWVQPVVRNPEQDADYVSLGAGKKTKPRFFADDRIMFIVWDGSLRVTIDGAEPFTATKGFMVSVPFRHVYSVENVGQQPAVWFEVRQAGTAPLYPAGETPDPVKGRTYVKVTGNPGPAKDRDTNPIYVDFFKTIAVGDKPYNGKFVWDDHWTSNILRGKAADAVPPDTNKGHFHTEWTEFWFIMEGKIGYKIEGYPYFTSEPGDVVTAARGRWHRAGNDPSAPMSTRIPINPRPVILHNFEPAH
ncbi:cupin domain-containing protein [Sphingomonas sp. RRHST34]|uniref:Cupin domain-containing protein n=1 Tax=Sphingomonas citri TaxID=2862499 RepID=A0ABS7BPS8_9SPHN|nr:cupin domain-containing protein [Sphingomonas citri]MBW6531548.1 cupin domain-containing protein [Sphingomonas citri]